MRPCEELKLAGFLSFSQQLRCLSRYLRKFKTGADSVAEIVKTVQQP